MGCEAQLTRTQTGGGKCQGKGKIVRGEMVVDKLFGVCLENVQIPIQD